MLVAHLWGGWRDPELMTGPYTHQVLIMDRKIISHLHICTTFRKGIQLIGFFKKITQSPTKFILVFLLSFFLSVVTKHMCPLFAFCSQIHFTIFPCKQYFSGSFANGFHLELDAGKSSQEMKWEEGMSQGIFFPSPEPLRSNGNPGGGCSTSLAPGSAQQPHPDPSCHCEAPTLVLLTPPDAVSPPVLVLRAAAVDFQNANLPSEYSDMFVTGSLYCIPSFKQPAVGYFPDWILIDTTYQYGINFWTLKSISPPHSSENTWSH